MSHPSDPIIEPMARSRTRLSWIWLIPIAALLVSLWALWQNYADRGPIITVAFNDAEDLTFTEDLSKVLAHIRVDTEVAPFVDAESVFWVVKPRVTTRGVSGLQTISFCVQRMVTRSQKAHRSCLRALKWGRSRDPDCRRLAMQSCLMHSSRPLMMR